MTMDRDGLAGIDERRISNGFKGDARDFTW